MITNTEIDEYDSFGFWKDQEWCNNRNIDASSEDGNLKIFNKTLIIIGDSTGDQIYKKYLESLKKLYKKKCQSEMIEFWGQPWQESCRPDITRNFQRLLSTCIDKTSKTQLAIIPHGKPIHHGGCDPGRMPWMIDTIDKLIENVDQDRPTILLLTPGIHFLIMNPFFYFIRLVELRTKLHEYAEKVKNLKIFIKTPSYFRGDFKELNCCISSYNSYTIGQVIKKIFDNDPVVTVIDVYKMTETVFDEFTPSSPGIHPGTHGGGKYVLNGVMKLINSYL